MCYMCFMCLICSWTHRWPAGPSYIIYIWTVQHNVYFTLIYMIWYDIRNELWLMISCMIWNIHICCLRRNTPPPLPPQLIGNIKKWWRRRWSQRRRSAPPPPPQPPPPAPLPHHPKTWFIFGKDFFYLQFLVATKRLYKRFCPSVRPSVRPSVGWWRFCFSTF